MDTKAAFNGAYSNYDAYSIEGAAKRAAGHAKHVKPWADRLGPSGGVLEVGAGMGHLHTVHPGYRGIEYSEVAVAKGRKLFPGIRLEQGDARSLPVGSSSIDLLFSFQTLEHVPDVERAFDEINRVLAVNGIALLAPAWNCRSWTVKRLQLRPYRELTLLEMIAKALIPIRDNVGFRALASIPRRVALEALHWGTRIRLPLIYRALEPDFTLDARYPHISDCDAFISLDAHSAIMWFMQRNYEVLSHRGLKQRLFARAETVIVRKRRAQA